MQADMVILVPRTREGLSAKAFFRICCVSALFLNHQGNRGSGKSAFRKCAQHKGCSFAVIHPQVWNETQDVFLHSCMLFLPFVNILYYTWNLHKKEKQPPKMWKYYNRATQEHFVQSRSDSALIADKWLLKKIFLHGSLDLEALPLFRVI